MALTYIQGAKISAELQDNWSEYRDEKTESAVETALYIKFVKPAATAADIASDAETLAEIGELVKLYAPTAWGAWKIAGVAAAGVAGVAILGGIGIMLFGGREAAATVVQTGTDIVPVA